MDQGQFYSSLGVVWVFGFVAVFIVIWHLRNKRRMEKLNMIHVERMKAIEKGIPLPEFPEFTDEEGKKRIGRALAGHMEGRPWNPRWPLGLGALLIMAGLGTSVAMLAYSAAALGTIGWTLRHAPLPTIDLSAPWLPVAAFVAVPLSLMLAIVASRWLPAFGPRRDLGAFAL